MTWWIKPSKCMRADTSTGGLVSTLARRSILSNMDDARLPAAEHYSDANEKEGIVVA
jgi:hypothetical protein